MGNLPTPQPTLNVYTRHSSGCPYRKNRYSRQCTCPKWFEIQGDGCRRRVSARTRDGRTADDLAAAEQERLRAGPAPPAEQVKPLTVEEGLAKWIASFKRRWAPSTIVQYGTFKRKVQRWATEKKITLLRDITSSHLETWREEWGLGDLLPPSVENPKGAPRRTDDKIGAPSQNQFQGYLKRFCHWAHTRGHFAVNPAAVLDSIRPDDKRTMPLTLEQFDELIAAAEKYDSYRMRPMDRFGAELKAIFLVQRWTGLRILDVLALPRKALVGNALSLKTIKTGAKVKATLPLHVVAALAAIPPRPGTHKDYFFWSTTCKYAVLRSQWLCRIRKLRPQLSFVDEHGQPMVFHSHMLRDTFAVQLILAGAHVDEVSALLTHKSIAVTQRYYMRWIKEMETQLQDKHIELMKKMGARFAA